MELGEGEGSLHYRRKDSGKALVWVLPAYPMKLSDIWTGCVMNLALPLPLLLDDDSSAGRPCLETAAANVVKTMVGIGQQLRINTCGMCET